LKVILIHPSLNRMGGAERVCLEMIRCLKELGADVVLYTLERTDWGTIESRAPNVARPDGEVYRMEKIPPSRSPLEWALLAVSYLSLLVQSKKSGGALTINNYGEVFPFVSDLAYTHSKPLYACTRHENPYRVPLWRLSSKLYRMVFLLMGKIFHESSILANSKYSKRQIYGCLKREALVIYPPVDVESRVGEGRRKRIVLTVSRITSEKDIGVIPRIASLVRCEGCCFVLMGDRAEDTKEALGLVSLLSSKLGVYIEVVLDPSASEIRAVMGSSSVYLSTQPSEAFGMAVMEAMASGCVPVVPREGGPWYDILEERQGYCGFSYVDELEASRHIDAVMSDEGLRLEMAERAALRAKSFCVERFKGSFKALVKKLAVALDPG